MEYEEAYKILEEYDPEYAYTNEFEKKVNVAMGMSMSALQSVNDIRNIVKDVKEGKIDEHSAFKKIAKLVD